MLTLRLKILPTRLQRSQEEPLRTVEARTRSSWDKTLTCNSPKPGYTRKKRGQGFRPLSSNFQFYALPAVKVLLQGCGHCLNVPTQLPTPMDASILIVGSDEFKTTLLERLPCLAASRLQVASNPKEALPSIGIQQPDLVILQALQAGSLELCRQLKQQTSLAWIYCILIAEQPQNAIEEILPGWNWELGFRAAALEGGADAYLWLLPAREDKDISWEAGLTLQNHLLQAQIQAGIRRVQLYRHLMHTNDLLSAIALADPLTELSNRRALDWELPRQIQNARTRSAPLSLLMLDVDYFKSINDTYGHLAGDRVLQLLSARLRHNLRFQDTPFRYGGEEFVIILSNTNANEAQAVALRLNHLVGNQSFTIDNNLALQITASVGIASLQPEDDPNGVSLLNRADRNLLRAKSNGRNRVICEDLLQDDTQAREGNKESRGAGE